MEADEPPPHVLLGKAALTVTRTKLEALKTGFDRWEQTTVEADYPEKTAA